LQRVVEPYSDLKKKQYTQTVVGAPTQRGRLQISLRSGT